jgi:rhodanese-related sulfurtransferase
MELQAMVRNRQGRWLRILPVILLGLFASSVRAQFQPPTAIDRAASIPLSDLMQPQQLHEMLQHPTHHPPLILQVGSRMLFSEAHIPGSEYAGPGAQPEGRQLLRKRVASLPKNKLIVLYCGCCPWERCPNLGPAFQQLLDLGFTNVKALYIANNLGADWAAKGYGVEK